MIEADNATSQENESAAAEAAIAAAEETRGDSEREMRRAQTDDAVADAKMHNPAAQETRGAHAPAPTNGSPSVRSDIPPAGLYLEPLVLQIGLQPGEREQYHVAELLQYHDRAFVESVYVAILGRRPNDEERARELAELQSGRTSKVEIIERLLATTPGKDEAADASPAGRRSRVAGLPSPLMRRLSRVPVLGHALRIGRAVWRLPILMRHQQQFEIYALAQQQLIADYVNQTLPQLVAGQTGGGVASPVADDLFEAVKMFSDALLDLSNSHVSLQAETQMQVERMGDVQETVKIFSDALLDLSNGHAGLQAQVGVQVEQIEAALANLTRAITAQQGVSEEMRREQHTLADAQQEFLIQEQRVIVETQKVVLEELREELRELARRQENVRAEFDAEVRRLHSLADAGLPPPHSSNL